MSVVFVCACELWFDRSYDSARISMKRESAVSKEVLAELSSGSGKKLTKAEKDERYIKFYTFYGSSLYT